MTYADPVHWVWNCAMAVFGLLVIVDLARGSRWTNRRERVWTGALVLIPGGFVGGFSLPVGVLAWVAWYRWRGTAGYHPKGRPSAEVEDGPDDLTAAHGGDGVADLL